MNRPARELYTAVGLPAIPRILALLDRNRLSPTYGCFDKAFWHFRTAGFASGMAQEFVLPLALAYHHALPGGEDYFQQPRLREWVLAGIRYAALSAHGDGSCDDYFPYERALGAVAFSLYACTESALLLGLREPLCEAFFRRRGQWLLSHDEAGRLANHHALAVLALYNVYLYTAETRFREGAQTRLARLLGWQSAEGWFPEYEGCDPGYNTASIDFLAKYYHKSGDAQVLEPLRRSVRFCVDFMHPDGSFGGEYGSRNTYLFFPHGCELLGDEIAEAAWLADCYLQGVRRGRRVVMEDDRLIGHLTYNHLQAFVDYRPQRRPFAPPTPYTRLWQEAGLYVRRQHDLYAVVSVAKGGVCKLFAGDRLVHSDSGLIARRGDGRCLVSHLIDRYEYEVQEHDLRVTGHFGYASYRVFTPLSIMTFHFTMVTLGRFCRNLIRGLLQRLLIVGKRRAALVFQRTLYLQPPLTVVDEIWDPSPQRRGRHRLTDLYLGTDHTSIYVAMSNAYQASCLRPWTDDAAALAELTRSGYVKITRTLDPGGRS